MYFESLTRRSEIGANSYLLDLDGCRVVLDAGLHPKEERGDALPRYDAIDYDSIEGIVITHSHLDHTGSLPILMRSQPSAPVYMTEATGALVEAMLHNSVNVMCAKRDELDIPEYPLFTHKEVEKLPWSWQYRRVGKTFEIGNDREAPVCEFFDAGHILGSVGAMFHYRGKRIFYTGDVNFEDQTISKGAAFPDYKLDTLIMETTRGAHPRPEDYTREGEIGRMAEKISEAIARGGSVLIPVFAMGKTQEVLVMLNTLRESGEIPECPVYIGGLSTKMTIIFDKFADSVRRNFPGFEILKEMEIEYSPRRRKRRTLTCLPGCIYALSSGMMTENTVSNSFAQDFLHDPRNALIFVGYAAPDSPAGAILDAERGDMITLNEEAPQVELLCDVERYDFSGHSTRDALFDYVKTTKPDKLLLVHGDDGAMAWFAERVWEELPDTEVIIPEPGNKVPLDDAAEA